MKDYEEFIDEQTGEEGTGIEEDREELLEEDEISTSEEAFLKGYEDASDEDEGDGDDEVEEE